MVHYNYKKLVRGCKRYELSNHLGNVLVVISDKRITLCSSSVVSGYEADIISATDYAAFGAPLEGRTYSSEMYRYGFNGKENDNEIKGEGNEQDYGFRISDTRLGRFLSEDPLTKKYPELTPYQFASNNPIENIDLDGLEGTPSTTNPNAGTGATTTSGAEYHDPHLKLIPANFKLTPLPDNSQTNTTPQPSTSTQPNNTPQPASTPQPAKTSQPASTPQQANTPTTSQPPTGATPSLVGPTLMLLGANILETMGKFAGATPGTSIASKLLSKALPQTFTGTFGVKTGTQIAKTLGTNVLGRSLGRLVPMAGMALTVYDVTKALLQNGKYTDFSIQYELKNKTPLGLGPKW